MSPRLPSGLLQIFLTASALAIALHGVASGADDRAAAHDDKVVIDALKVMPPDAEFLMVVNLDAMLKRYDEPARNLWTTTVAKPRGDEIDPNQKPGEFIPADKTDLFMPGLLESFCGWFTERTVRQCLDLEQRREMPVPARLLSVARNVRDEPWENVERWERGEVFESCKVFVFHQEAETARFLELLKGKAKQDAVIEETPIYKWSRRDHPRKFTNAPPGFPLVYAPFDLYIMKIGPTGVAFAVQRPFLEEICRRMKLVDPEINHPLVGSAEWNSVDGKDAMWMIYRAGENAQVKETPLLRVSEDLTGVSIQCDGLLSGTMKIECFSKAKDPVAPCRAFMDKLQEAMQITIEVSPSTARSAKSSLALYVGNESPRPENSMPSHYIDYILAIYIGANAVF